MPKGQPASPAKGHHLEATRNGTLPLGLSVTVKVGTGSMEPGGLNLTCDVSRANIATASIIDIRMPIHMRGPAPKGIHW